MAVLDYKRLYQAAAARYHIPASVLAGDVQIESGGNVRAVSPAGAFGLTQFIPSTAQSYGVKPNDPQSEIMGQAHYLSDLGFSKNPSLALSKYNAGPGNPGAAGDYAQKVLDAAKQYAALDRAGANIGNLGIGSVPSMGSSVKLSKVPTTPSMNIFQVLSGLETTRQAISGESTDPLGSGWDTLAQLYGQQYTNQATQENSVIDQLNQEAGVHSGVTPTELTTNFSPSAHGDLNPLRHFTIGRTDMGVDASAAPGTPIVAPNASRIVAIYPNWYNGQPYVLTQLMAGPNKGKYIYYAEQVTKIPKVGTIVQRGQPIAYYAPSGTGVEVGWGTPTSKTLAQSTTGYSEGEQTRAGKSFRNYLHGLGA